MKIGFIGTGNFGTPMATNILKAGFKLFVYTRTKRKAFPLIEKGARWSDSPKELAAVCDVICTCLPGPLEMEQVALGENGILDGICPGSVYIDHTTNSPIIVRKVYEIYKKKGVFMLDAPASGGVEGAVTRDIIFMVGGEKSTLNRVKSVLTAMGKKVYYTGDIGTGSICKVLHNCANFCLNMIMTECWTLGVKVGVKPEVIVNIFQEGAIGRMSDLNIRLPATLFRGDFNPRFALKLARKDIGIATELGRTYNVSMRMAELLEQEMIDAMARGWGDEDSSIFLTLQEERAQVKIRFND